VDDGSTDASRQIISSFSRDCIYAQAIYKKNGGQLSCFHAALEFIQPDDAVFFLDSDDLYPHDYLEKVSDFITKETFDFIFVNPIKFSDSEKPLQSACLRPEKSYLFSSTSALTRKMHCWIGAETSCLCISGSLLHSILPYPYEKDWIARADDVLIFGSSIIGARKLYIESLGIAYRVHASNNFVGRTITATERAIWRLRHERLFKWYSEKSGVSEQSSLKNTLHEAALIPRYTRKLFGLPSPAFIYLYDILILIPIVKILIKDMAGFRHE
jgi:glycosyltransferase involved in cell wall biosynthesis